MKFKNLLNIKFTTLLFIVLQTALHSQPNFFWQHPLPTGNLLNSVRFMNSQTGFAVGDVGTIMKTTNGGQNWNIISSPISASLLDVTFVNSNIIVCAGTIFGTPTNNGVILRSSNGGDNWNIIQNQTNATYRRVDFPSTNVGFIAGAGVILKSTDAGLSWVQQPAGIGNFYSIDFFDENIGAAGGTNRLMLTTNGGVNWILQNITYNSLLDQVVGIVQIDANNVLGTINSLNGESVKTTNAGTNWTKYPMNIPISSGGNVDIVKNIKIVNNTSFVVTDFGRILKSTDSGINWTIDSTTYKPPFGMAFVLWNLDMIDDSNLFISGGGGFIAKTSNSGLNWVTQVGFLRNLRDINFPSVNIGYAVGEGGTVLKTTNTGQNWNLISTGTTRHLQSVYFTDINTGYAVGDTGIILKSVNGGLNWSNQTSGTTINLLSVLFTDSNTGYAAGGENNNGNGVILKTTNSGNNWFTQFSGTSLNLTSLHFLNASTGFVSATSNIYKTTNGGVNWITITGAEGYDIYFVNSSTGYTMCSNPNVYKTTNSGENWFVVSSGFTSGYHSIQFFGNFGIAVGDRGRIIKTTNAGLNWVSLTSITNNNLSSVYFIDENTGYIAGDFGAIIKTTNGGLSFIQANNEIIPKGFQLYQNFPNPFNPSTMIKFDVPQNAKGRIENVKLTVYGIQGKEVAVLVDEELGSGVYEVSFDAGLFSSGIYFYTLRTIDFIETKKMILLK